MSGIRFWIFRRLVRAIGKRGLGNGARALFKIVQKRVRATSLPLVLNRSEGKAKSIHVQSGLERTVSERHAIVAATPASPVMQTCARWRCRRHSYDKGQAALAPTGGRCEVGLVHHAGVLFTRIAVRHSVRVLFVGLLSGFAALQLGCQPPKPTTPQKVTVTPVPLPTDRPATPDEAVGSDECSLRLHDLLGALLGFYAAHAKLPDTLEDIKPYADFGTALKFSCPISNKPFVYSAAGLMKAGNEMRIVVWDPEPSHNGIRWCIFMPHLQPGVSVVPQVIPVPEATFKAFVPAFQ